MDRIRDAILTLCQFSDEDRLHAYKGLVSEVAAYITAFSIGERMCDNDIRLVRCALRGVSWDTFAAHFATAAERDVCPPATRKGSPHLRAPDPGVA